MRRALEYTVPVLLGLLGGGIAVHLFEDDPQAKPRAEALTPTRRPTATDPALMQRLARLERMASDQQERRNPVAIPSPASAPPSPTAQQQESRAPSPVPMTREAARERAEEEFDQRVRRHEDGPVDPEWAADASATFSEDINALGDEHGFALVDIECRSSSCLAEVQWPDQKAADSSWAALLHTQYGMNCGRGVFLSEPDDPHEAVQARVLFECDA